MTLAPRLRSSAFYEGLRVVLQFKFMKATRKRALITGVFVMLIAVGFFISRNFRERIHGIPPHGGESLMVSAISTANYLQRDPQWANDTIAGSNETLARVGCTVCTLAMALDHYGIKISPKRLDSMTL